MTKNPVPQTPAQIELDKKRYEEQMDLIASAGRNPPPVVERATSTAPATESTSSNPPPATQRKPRGRKQPAKKPKAGADYTNPINIEELPNASTTAAESMATSHPAANQMDNRSLPQPAQNTSMPLGQSMPLPGQMPPPTQVPTPSSPAQQAGRKRALNEPGMSQYGNVRPSKRPHVEGSMYHQFQIDPAARSVPKQLQGQSFHNPPRTINGNQHRLNGFQSSQSGQTFIPSQGIAPLVTGTPALETAQLYQELQNKQATHTSRPHRPMPARDSPLPAYVAKHPNFEGQQPPGEAASQYGMFNGSKDPMYNFPMPPNGQLDPRAVGGSSRVPVARYENKGNGLQFPMGNPSAHSVMGGRMNGAAPPVTMQSHSPRGVSSTVQASTPAGFRGVHGGQRRPVARQQSRQNHQQAQPAALSQQQAHPQGPQAGPQTQSGLAGTQAIESRFLSPAEHDELAGYVNSPFRVASLSSQPHRVQLRMYREFRSVWPRSMDELRAIKNFVAFYRSPAGQNPQNQQVQHAPNLHVQSSQPAGPAITPSMTPSAQAQTAQPVAPPFQGHHIQGRPLVGQQSSSAPFPAQAGVGCGAPQNVQSVSQGQQNYPLYRPNAAKSVVNLTNEAIESAPIQPVQPESATQPTPAQFIGIGNVRTESASQFPALPDSTAPNTPALVDGTVETPVDDEADPATPSDPSNAPQPAKAKYVPREIDAVTAFQRGHHVNGQLTEKQREARLQQLFADEEYNLIDRISFIRDGNPVAWPVWQGRAYIEKKQLLTQSQSFDGRSKAEDEARILAIELRDAREATRPSAKQKRLLEEADAEAEDEATTERANEMLERIKILNEHYKGVRSYNLGDQAAVTRGWVMYLAEKHEGTTSGKGRKRRAKDEDEPEASQPKKKAKQGKPKTKKGKGQKRKASEEDDELDFARSSKKARSAEPEEPESDSDSEGMSAEALEAGLRAAFEEAEGEVDGAEHETEEVTVQDDTVVVEHTADHPAAYKTTVEEKTLPEEATADDDLDSLFDGDVDDDDEHASPADEDFDSVTGEEIASSGCAKPRRHINDFQDGEEFDLLNDVIPRDEANAGFEAELQEVVTQEEPEFQEAAIQAEEFERADAREEPQHEEAEEVSEGEGYQDTGGYIESSEESEEE
ncbi:hypothetical protein BT63DRAFT_458997 [Microthyrium microscopicum]|uniref:Uncharacterized protein n=1 Tax=Microthyrium microscopicum TaxID=703497 RepID=A0A6A6U1D9_9PEZI|nr:hypothetical protein BT63DRAFT_458997 [Microthyrium microscopicum]